MSSVGTVAVAAHEAVSPAPLLPTEPQCLGSHYLDKYICPVDQPTGPVSSFAPLPPPPLPPPPQRCYHSPDYIVTPSGQELGWNHKSSDQSQFTPLLNIRLQRRSGSAPV